MTYTTQPLNEFLEEFRAWAVKQKATTVFIDKIDELIEDYDGRYGRRKDKDCRKSGAR